MRSKVSRMRFAVDDVTDDASDLFTGFAVTVLRCGVNCNTIQLALNIQYDRVTLVVRNTGRHRDRHRY